MTILVVSALTKSASAQTNCVGIPSDLISWWRAEADTTDWSGLNNGTAINGVGFAAGLVGQAFALNGQNQYVEAPDSPTLSPGIAMTLEAWVYAATTSPASTVMIIAGKDDAHVAREYLLVLKIVGTQLVFRPHVGVATGFMYFDGKTPIQIDTWTHVAMTYDGNNLNLYVNGNLDGSLAVSGLIITTSEPFRIGGLPTGPWYFSGMLDEVTLYNRALSASEIVALYNAGSQGKCSSPTPPSIFLQPTNQTVIVGRDATFGVKAGGSSPLNYQWCFNTTNINGATDSMLVLTGVQTNQAGNYSVQISNPYGSITSSVAVLTVNPPTGCVSPNPYLVSWWRAEVDASDSVGGNTGSLQNGAGFSTGLSGQAFALNGANQFIQVSNSPSLNPTNGLTLEAWVNAATVTPASQLMIVAGKDDAGGSRQYLLVLTMVGNQLVFRPHVGIAGVGFQYFNGTIPLQSNTWTHVAMTYDGSFLRLYVNGAPDGSLAVSGSIVTTAQPLQIGGLTAGPWYFNGLLDEVSFYSRALSAGEIQAIYEADVSGKCITNIAPFVITQPPNKSVVVGSNTTFSVVAGGTYPLNYQWTLRGTNIPGATADTYAITNAQFGNGGLYAVIITNVAGSVTSAVANLNVTFPPATIRISSTNVVAGTAFSLPVTLAANGNENALGFSLGFNNSVIAFTGATLASGSQGAALFINTNQLSGGKLGLAVTLAPNATFPVGTQQVFLVNFTAITTNNSSTTITFGDQPTLRQLTDPQFNTLAATFSSGSVSVAAATNFEGDTFPRPSGDRAVTFTDWLQLGRYVARLDYPTNGVEFQKADCAPRQTLGDGSIRATDWAQVGRYEAGFDAAVPAGGPTNEIAVTSPGPSGSRVLTTVSTPFVQGQAGVVRVNISAQGNENALGFSVAFNPILLSYSGSALGGGATGAILYANTNQISSGRLAFALAMPPGESFAPGLRELIRVNFTASSTASGTAPFSFTDQPAPREVSDLNASTLPVSYSNSATIVSAPIPALRIAQSGSNIVLSWPLWATNYSLQVASGALPPSGTWTNFSVSVTPTNGENVAVVPRSVISKFYRLRSF